MSSLSSEARKKLAALLGPKGFLDKPEDLKLYEYDGSVDKVLPDMVVFPRSTEDVVEIVKLSKDFGIPIVGRGAGTGLSGGSIPMQRGIIIAFARMNRILADRRRKRAGHCTTGRRQSGYHPFGAGAEVLLRSRSIEPASLHHRRQRRRKCGRTPHPCLRRDHQSRARSGVRAAGWIVDHRPAAKCRIRRATILPDCSPAPKAPWRSSRKSWCA